MTVKEVEENILKDSRSALEKIRQLAPQNSRYKSYDRGKLVNYIYVDGRRVFTNSNNLFNSLKVETRNQPFSKVIELVVSENDVPYYREAVLERTRIVARHFGRTDYGKLRYGTSEMVVKGNRNYMYYDDGIQYVKDVIAKWDGKIINVTDSIGEWTNEK